MVGDGGGEQSQRILLAAQKAASDKTAPIWHELREFDRRVTRMETTGGLFKWIAGLSIPVIILIAIALVNVWADTNENMKELGKREADVKEIPIIKERMRNIDERTKATHETVNAIARQQGIKPAPIEEPN